MAKLLRRKSSVKGLDTDLSNIKSAAGLAADLTYTQHSGSNFIDAAQSLRAADLALDGALKTANDSVGSVASLTTTATTVVGAINEIDAEVGTLSSLATTEKGTIVGAINELDGRVVELEDAVGAATGDLADLTTTAKDTLVAAINELDAEIGSDTLTTEATTLSAAINELDAAVDTLNGADTVDGSVAKSVKTAKDAIVGVKSDESVSTETISSLDDKIAILNGDSSTDGSVAKAIADVVGAAPEALDTLKEIADFLDTNPDADPLSGLMQVVKDAKDELKGAVSESFDTLEEIEDAIEIINGSDTTEGSIAKALADAKSYADDLDTAMDTRVDALESSVGAATGVLADLTTDAKSNLVAAINEVDAHADANATAISTLDAAALKKASNLSDVADVATARTNLGVYSKTEVDAAISTQSNATKNAVGTIGGTAGAHTVEFAYAPVGGVDGIAFGVVRIYGVDGSIATYDEVEVSLDTFDATGKTFIISSSEDYSGTGLVAKAFITYNPTV
jgi:uncharacterized phage infection (PIP) family protein YhgE